MSSRRFTQSRIWVGLAVLAGVSLAGDYICHRLAGAADQERLLEKASQGVGALPADIGPWRLERTEPFDEAVLRILKCRIHQSRVYVDEQTGDSILLTLLAGFAGPMVAHTPEFCYSSTEFELDESPKAEVIRQTDGQADTFGHVAFRSKSLAGQRQEVFYAWRKHDGPWEAPLSPRLALGGQPMLYKLQLAIVCPASAADKSYADETMRRFLADLLPVLDQIL